MCLAGSLGAWRSCYLARLRGVRRAHALTRPCTTHVSPLPRACAGCTCTPAACAGCPHPFAATSAAAPRCTACTCATRTHGTCHRMMIHTTGPHGTARMPNPRLCAPPSRPRRTQLAAKHPLQHPMYSPLPEASRATAFRAASPATPRRLPSPRRAAPHALGHGPVAQQHEPQLVLGLDADHLPWRPHGRVLRPRPEDTRATPTFGERGSAGRARRTGKAPGMACTTVTLRGVRAARRPRKSRQPTARWTSGRGSDTSRHLPLHPSPRWPRGPPHGPGLHHGVLRRRPWERARERKKRSPWVSARRRTSASSSAKVLSTARATCCARRACHVAYCWRLICCSSRCSVRPTMAHLTGFGGRRDVGTGLRCQVRERGRAARAWRVGQPRKGARVQARGGQGCWRCWREAGTEGGRRGASSGVRRHSCPARTHATAPPAGRAASTHGRLCHRCPAPPEVILLRLVAQVAQVEA
jgi:hypothetical protein